MGHDEVKHPRESSGRWKETTKPVASVGVTDVPAEAERLGLSADQYADYRILLADPDFKVKYLHNPFRKGETVVIPAGTPFRSMNPSIKGPQVTKKTQTVVAHMTSPGYRPQSGYDGAAARVTIAGGGGYWKDFEVTEEMLEANDKPVAMIPRDYWNTDMPIESDFHDTDTPVNRTWRDHVANGGD
ncbi:hypothetical protein AB3M81_06705 [Aeromicrobium sp. 179-A 4D2 NHS]